MTESNNNFSNVINANGGLVTISGEVLSFQPPQGAGPYKCQIKDSTGRAEEVGCWPPKQGKQGMVPSQALIGVMVNLYCSYKNYKGKNQFTGGILSISQMAQKPNTIQQAYDEAKAAQDALQAPQNAPQSSNGRDASIEAQACFKAACDRFSGTDANDLQVLNLAAEGLYFVQHGQKSPAK